MGRLLQPKKQHRHTGVSEWMSKNNTAAKPTLRIPRYQRITVRLELLHLQNQLGIFLGIAEVVLLL